MNIADLRSTLHVHADQPDDIAVTERVNGARRRATTMRRQRLAFEAGVIALVLPLIVAGILGVNPLGRNHATEPADGSAQDVLRSSFAGRTLIDSKVATGVGDLALTVTSDGASQWAATCFGVGDAYTLHQRIEGWEGESRCLDSAPSDPPWGPRLDEGEADLAHTHTMRIWITRTSDGQAASPADAVLALGAYRLPPITSVVAETSVYELEESEGTTWAIADTAQSAPGAPTFTTTYDSGNQPVFIEIVTAGPTDTNVVVRVDGRQARGPGHLGADPCWLGSFPAGSHRVTLKVHGPAPADAVLGVVWRTSGG